MGEVTTARMKVMWHYFTGRRCPVCANPKGTRQCFCRSCYFAVKAGDPRLAAGLWTSALDHTHEFFEKYAACADWLRSHGHGNPDWTTVETSGSLFL
jgi:hypothetical protein